MASAQLRIVHIMRAPMGGVFRHVRDLALAQTQAGHLVSIICDASGSPGYQEAGLEQLNVHLGMGVHRIPMSRSVGPPDLKTGWQIVHKLKALAPDVVHGHGAKGGVYARAFGGFAKQKQKIARIYSPHGGSLHFEPNSRAGRIYFTVERALERSCDMILFVAKYEEDTYSAKIGSPRCATKIVYNGLANSEFEPVKADAKAVDFLYIGEMRELKGPDIVIEVAKRLRAQGHGDVRFLMVGDGVQKQEYVDMVAANNLEESIAFSAPMPARAAFAKARIVLMPSRAEAMPYIVIEALAAGKPIVATRVGGIPEIFAERADCLIEPNADAFFAVVSAILRDPAEAAKYTMNKNALISRFSAGVMAESIMNAYRAALANV